MEKAGSNWRDEELDAIVADYFAMLRKELAGDGYVKARHNAALGTKVGRSRGSIERKHQNISAVLQVLGMPWIPGYLPLRNYQNAILGAIDRYLTGHPEALDATPSPARTKVLPEAVFVEEPRPDAGNEPTLEAMQCLVRKYDREALDYRNRKLGSEGEVFVVGVEQRRLAQAGRDDLAKRIRWVAREDGDGAGFDVLSYDARGQERLLEVKTTCGSARTPFFVTRNECKLARERPDAWRIYRVHQFAQAPQIFVISPPLESRVSLSPEVWKASFARRRVKAAGAG